MMSASVTVEQGKCDENGYEYVVVSTTNRTTPRINAIIKERDIHALIADGVRVHIRGSNL